MNLFDNEQNIIKFDLPDADVVLYQNFFNKQESNEFFKKLKNDIEWRQDKMKIYGNEINLPRLTAWYGDNDKNYTFSGITLNPKNWTNELIDIKNIVEQVSSYKFNSVLLNLYRNGKDSISWHTDAEPELGKNPVIVSVSFGANRKFQLRHKLKKDVDTVSMDLTHGSLLIMKGTTQHFWQHQIPKTNENNNERINLTFRKIL